MYLIGIKLFLFLNQTKNQLITKPMGNAKVKLSILLLIGAFLFLQFKPVNKNTKIQYQQDMSHLLEKEAQEQFSYIQEQIENHLPAHIMHGSSVT